MSVAAMAATARWLGRAIEAVRGPRLPILIFHRVLREPDPLFPGEVTAARFDRLMQAVAVLYDVTPLHEAAASVRAGTLRPRTLVLTFDDGYADNRTEALPILQRHGLHATFFVATGFLDGGRMFNDTVIECLRRTDRPALDLGAFGLGTLPAGSHAQRRAVVEALLPQIKYMTLDARDAALDRLLHAAGRPRLPDDLMMRSPQVRELHAAGMEIGAHTVRHPIFTLTDDADAERELSGGRRQLESLVGAPVQSFAYPNGSPGRDYDRRHRDMAERLGFAAAVTTAPGVSRDGDDVFQLPRFTPWDRSDGRWLLRLARMQASDGFAVAARA